MKKGELPKGWAWAKLGDLGKWLGGGTPSKAKPTYWSGGNIPWVSAKDMKVPVIHDTEDHITRQAVSESATNLVPSGTVLFVTRSGILRHTFPVATTAVEVAINQDLKALIPFDGLDPDYISNAVRAAEQRILHECSKDGTTVQSIEFARLQDFEIPIAPAAQQERIVAAIDALFTRLDSASAGLETSETLLKRYRQSILTAAVTGKLTQDWRAGSRNHESAASLLRQVLARKQAAAHNSHQQFEEPIGPRKPWFAELPDSWCWASVDQLVELVQYGTSAKCGNDLAGTPVLRMGNLVEGRIDTADLKYLPSDHVEFPTLLLQPGDILFNRTNSYELVGKTAVFREGGIYSFASYLIRVRVDGILPEFLSCIINSSIGRRWIVSVVSQQVGQANVNGSKLRALTVPLPPAEEQRIIVGRLTALLDSARSAEEQVSAHRKSLSAIRQSVLGAAFRGELLPQDPNDEPAEKLLERIRSRRAAVAAPPKRASRKPKKAAA